MLKIVKVKKTKKGFTLLETLLSVALLVIVSSMMMNGFMGSINYSHNTSVYAKSAGNNYKEAMSELGFYAVKAAEDKKAAYSSLEGATAEDGTMTFTGTGVAGTNLILNSDGELKVKVFSKTANTSGLHDNLGLSQFAENYGGSDDSYSDNRYSFTYIPSVNHDTDNHHIGEIRIFRQNSTGKLFWGYKKTNADGTTTFVSLGQVNN